MFIIGDLINYDLAVFKKKKKVQEQHSRCKKKKIKSHTWQDARPDHKNIIIKMLQRTLNLKTLKNITHIEVINVKYFWFNKFLLVCWDSWSLPHM